MDVKEIGIQRQEEPRFLSYNWNFLYQIPKTFMNEK